MIRLLGLRIAAAIPTLFCVVLLTFLLMHAAPGGPFDSERELLPEVEANLRAAYNLDAPLHIQFGKYIWGVIHGNFGPSFLYKDKSVSDLIATGLPVSLTLGGLALLIAIIVAIPLGSWAAFRKGSTVDTIISSFSLLGLTIPTFVTAPILVLIFAVFLGALPVSGWNEGAWKNLVLPVTALALPKIAILSRMMRASMIEALRQPHIRTAQAKGLGSVQIIFRHALRPALIPIVSYLGPAAAALFTGSIVIETVFGLPGVGRYFVQGALNRDYTLVMGVVIVYATLLVLFNLCADLAYGWLDPRTRQHR
jgi:oligopeptide transport system permease protein